MISATSRPDGPLLTLNASVSGPVVYLDNWAIGDLAEGDASRRKRFIAALSSGMDLLFSVTNAAELSGPRGKSADAVRAFLDEIGPRWFPVELDQKMVTDRELKGASPNDTCVSEDFLRSYTADRMRGYADSGKLVDFSDDFFRLGGMLDWVGPQRESIQEGSAKMDEAPRDRISVYVETSKREARWLNEKFPRLPFNPAFRATFTYINLIRTLIVEGNQVRENDGMDFCHAVMASAYGSFAALDKRWKRRVEALPKPNSLARIYSSAELDAMVDDMESWASRN